MNSNPRSIAIALATASALVLGLSACGNTGGTKPTNRNTTAAYPDCDLGDLRKGDKDCKDPRAFADAVRKYGRAKVDAAQKEYLKKVAPKVTSTPKLVTSTKPGVPGLRTTATSTRR